jgi:Ras-related protein Rab-1A
MLVYDVTDRKSFENLQEHWIPLSERYIGGGWSVGRIIVGSKAEMNSKRQVSKEEGKEYADSIDVPFFEVSARTGYNVTDAFTQLARETIAREKPKQYQREGPVDLTMFRAEEQPTSKCIIS